MKKRPLVKKRNATEVQLFNAIVMDMQKRGVKDADKIPFVVDTKEKNNENNDGGTD